MSERSRLRLTILQVMMLSLLMTLGARLWYLQVLAGEEYERAAADNQIREVVDPAVRGQIVDAMGRPLVRNQTALVVSVDYSTLQRQPDDGREVLKRLADVLDMSFDEVWDRTRLCGTEGAKPAPTCWNGSPYQPIPVTDEATTQQALQIEERSEDFPGVTAEMQPVRDYPEPEGANAAHMLGYLSPVTEEELEAQQDGGQTRLQRADLVGRAGLEREYDRYLRGEAGVKQMTVDHQGRVTGTAGEEPPVPGSHLVTSIDARIQASAERELENAIQRARSKTDKSGRRYEADSGAVVVMDHTNGQIVAMASYPTYDPSVWTGGISAKDYAHLQSEDAGVPLISRATQGQFAPASTFKIISTSAALMDGYSTDTRRDCSSGYRVGDRTFKNYESRAYGMIDFRRALEISCDTFFYRIAHEMWLEDGGSKPKKNPKDSMVRMAEAYGLGKPTGIDLPDESSGRIADREWKQNYWEQTKDSSCRRAETGYPEVAEDDPQRADYLQRLAKENCTDGWRYRAGDAVNFSIGQGDTLATPLQMAVAYSAVANGGTLWQPTLGKGIVTPEGEVVEEIKGKKNGKVPVSKGALDYIRSSLYGVTTRGTGAAPFAGFDLQEHPVASKTGTGEVYGKQTTSWFASFDERYTVVMMVSQGGTGSGTSGPSVRAIYEDIWGLGGKKAAVPGGTPPESLPTVRTDGSFAPPER